LKIPIRLVFLASFLSGCATAGCAAVDLSVKEGFDFEKVEKTGVLMFNSFGGEHAGLLGSMAAETFSQELLKAGFIVAARSRMEKARKEMNVDRTSLLDPASARKVGERAGVDAVIIGSVSPSLQGGKKVLSSRSSPSRATPRKKARSTSPGRPRTRRNVGVIVNAKMVDVASGEIVWVGTAQKRTDDLESSIKGAVRMIAKRLNGLSD